MKTAMQLAIEHYENLSLNGSNQAYVVAKFLKDNFLEMENQQIIDAFGVGCQVESKRLIGYQNMAEQYYKETFNK